MDEVIMKIGSNLYRFVNTVGGATCHDHCVLDDTIFCIQKGSLESGIELCSRLRFSMNKQKGCWERLDG